MSEVVGNGSWLGSRGLVRPFLVIVLRDETWFLVSPYRVVRPPGRGFLRQGVLSGWYL